MPNQSINSYVSNRAASRRLRSRLSLALSAMCFDGLKSVVFVVLLTTLVAEVAKAESGPFEKIEAESRVVRATFKSIGIRYHVSIDGRALGVSQYGQTIEIPEGKELILEEKHQRCVLIANSEVAPPKLSGTCTIVGPKITKDLAAEWITK